MFYYFLSTPGPLSEHLVPPSVPFLGLRRGCLDKEASARPARRPLAAVPAPIGEVPAESGDGSSHDLVAILVEIHNGTGQEEIPQAQEEDIEEEDEAQGDPTGVTLGQIAPEDRGFLHNEEATEGEEERVARDVVAMPLVAFMETGPLVREMVHQDAFRHWVKAVARQVLYEQEGLCGTQPESSPHHQTREMAEGEQDAACGQVDNEKNEATQENAGPTPGGSDKLAARKQRQVRKGPYGKSTRGCQLAQGYLLPLAAPPPIGEASAGGAWDCLRPAACMSYSPSPTATGKPSLSLSGSISSAHFYTVAPV